MPKIGKPAILMFEFPGRCHFGSYYVIRLPLLLSNNGCFVHRFPKGIVETMVRDNRYHAIAPLTLHTILFCAHLHVLWLNYVTVMGHGVKPGQKSVWLLTFYNISRNFICEFPCKTFPTNPSSSQSKYPA